MSDIAHPREEADEQNSAEDVAEEVELSEDDLDSVAGGSQDDWGDVDW